MHLDLGLSQGQVTGDLDPSRWFSGGRGSGLIFRVLRLCSFEVQEGFTSPLELGAVLLSTLISFPFGVSAEGILGYSGLRAL